MESVSLDANERRRRLVNAVEKLSETEIEELFKMIHNCGCNYTKNNNGIFLNLAWIDEELLQKLEKYIEFCNKSCIEIKKYESLCDVLNLKLHNKELSEIETTKQTTVKTQNQVFDANDDDVKKMSSSAKFMLFKKKYSKLNTFPQLDDELISETP